MAAEDQVPQPALLYGFLLSLFFNIVLIILTALSITSLTESLSGNKVLASIVTDREDTEFISQLCNELGINNEITIIAGPYYVHSFFSNSRNYHLNLLLSKYPIIVDPSDPTRRILMKGSVYSRLETEERRAVLAHEISHINSLINGEQAFGFSIDKEIEANRFAVKYVRPDVLINLYKKYGDNDSRIRLLIEDLERQKL